MSLKYRFDKLQENKPDAANDANAALPGNDIERFDSQSGVRNICLVTAEGKQVFLNYSYLMSGEFSPEENCIKLSFTTHIVTLHGHNLESLFDEFLIHTPKKIICANSRYAATRNDADCFVDQIKIEKAE